MRVAQTLTESQVHEGACKKIKFDEVCTSDSNAKAPTAASFLTLAVAVAVSLKSWL